MSTRQFQLLTYRYNETNPKREHWVRIRAFENPERDRRLREKRPDIDLEYGQITLVLVALVLGIVAWIVGSNFLVTTPV